MSFANCTGCNRRHKRPVNSKCDYKKAAQDRCIELGVPATDILLYLPELLEEDIDPADKMAGIRTNGSPSVGTASDISSELIHQLVTESVRSRKLLESSQNQVERMMTQLLELKIGSQQTAVTTSSLTSHSQPVSVFSTVTVPTPVTTTTTAATTMSASGTTWSPAVPIMAPWMSAPLPGSSASPGFQQAFPGSSTWPSYSSTQMGLPTTSTSGLQFPGPPGLSVPGAASAPPGLHASALPPGAPTSATAPSPYLPPYLLPGASQQTTQHVPYRCEIDHQHPPKSSTTAKRKLTVFDLDVHMRYASSASVTIDDIIAGSLSLLESMLRQGVDCSGYVRHVRFLVEKSKVYNPTSLIGYDAEMRERAEIFGPSVFGYGDHDLTHRWLGVDSLKSLSVGPQSSSVSGKKKSLRSNRFGSCWLWNENKSCKSNPCKYKHVCSKCQEDHKQVDCPSTKVSTGQGSKVSK